jgi:esterase/lipase superfamily enzyme
MIIISCRKKFTSPRIFSRYLQLRSTPDTGQLTPHAPLTFVDLRALADGQRLCLLVHGYNTTLANVLDAYAELWTGMEATGVAGPDGYGLVLGFAWPGGRSAPEFPVARRSANRAATYLARLVDHLRPVASAIDIETHSLGARVALGALKQMRSVVIDNLLLTAPAVDCTLLQPGREFHDAFATCNRCFVYHSRKDKILRKAYPIGDLADGIQPALGLNGPRSKKLTLEKSPNVFVVDCTACVPDHGGYRRATPVYTHWSRVLRGSPLPRYETLPPTDY